MRSHATKHTSGTILWIAVVLLVLAALGNHQRFETCIGDCCQHADALYDAPVEASPKCCCCSEDTPSPGDDLGDEVRSSCGPGCCITLALDIEMAPAQTAIDMEQLPLHTPPCSSAVASPIVHRETRRLRPFDRGPPRTDRNTALRASTVLQI